uniref:Uncharacterized protein n=1 Tax=Fundulus heteroclitus TaxID=8078 RepID=A0A3Q2PSX9_FUNHE
MGDAPRYCQLLLPPRIRALPLKTLSPGFKPGVPSLSSLTSLAAVWTQSHFQGDLVTFPVCPLLALFMLSVRSPMPPRLESKVPRGWIRTAVLGQGETPANASGATMEHSTSYQQEGVPIGFT